MDDRIVRSSSLVAVAAQVVLVASWLAAGFWQGPAYSVVSDSISDLSADTAPAGLWLALVISLCGLATILFAWLAVRPALREAGRLATVGSLLLGLSIYGLGNLLSPFKRVACRIADGGCSPSDQLASPGGLADAIVSVLGIACFVAAIFVLSAAMAHSADWRYLARRARWLGFVFLVLLFGGSILASVIGGFGLVNRALAITGAVGIAGLASEIAQRRDA